MKEILAQLKSVHKAFVAYGAGFAYLYYRYWHAPKILRRAEPLERPVTHPNLSVHMLTCHRDVLIAAWSLASFYATSRVIGKLTIHDDGTLTESDTRTLTRLFPSARIIRVADFLEKHAGSLARFPDLLTFRREYKRFQSKKLIDVYLERQGDTVLFLDSDLLWFQPSAEIADAVERGARDVSYMMSNGAERVHVDFKDGTRTTDSIAECNSGVTLFHESNYSLADVARYVQNTDYMHKKFTDQACFGTVLKHVAILPRDRYFIKGTVDDRTVMRHYTGPSREKFYFYGINFLREKIPV